MRYLTTSSREIRVMKQVWPTESAQIESILSSVKAHLEGAKEKFYGAMLVILVAVSSPDTQQRTQALRVYEAIRSNIQPVFKICLHYIKQAQAILKTLEPKIDKETEESEKNAVKASRSAIAVAGIAALAITGAWMIAVPAALLITAGCFGISSQRRDELRNDLAYYQAAITIINGLETMKSLLKLDAIFCNV
ncbi:Hypp3008 [Branchiostoma lanceolatum]|uniref:Hypp3008 protein n=1 Tax=Branchiostoma lanceolatum TaxID=7740 RepID=A0A8J9ZVR5_BRALA|nr:Hypp3008 [Branchiostoma lanceolatum]